MITEIFFSHYSFSQKKQRSNLLEVVKATKDFANVDEDSKGLQVEKALKQVTLRSF